MCVCIVIGRWICNCVKSCALVVDNNQVTSSVVQTCTCMCVHMYIILCMASYNYI